MADKKQTLGQAIDQIINALESLDQGARQTAIKAACAHLSIGSSSDYSSNNESFKNQSGVKTEQEADSVKLPSTSSIDIRTLKEQKQPATASQMACIVAYYLQEFAPENERKDGVTSKDLEKYFKQANFKLPKTISQLLPDSRAAGYFDSGSGKGEYKLNAVGYNLVAHNLPKKKSK
ncbi:MAG TPA: hypothetical protein VI749_02240 [Candidatus Omnitrophota bacterium]|nr:hypothetical protein [Candidatus Omnitrophota bacterium]